MPNPNKEDFARLLRFLKSFDFLQKKNSGTVRSILAMYNFSLLAPDSKKIIHYQDLAEKMLDYDTYTKVLEIATGLIQETSTLNSFLEMIGEESLEPPPAFVKDFMQSLPVGSIFRPKNTLAELVEFFKKASSDIRYCIVVDEGNNTLRGIISVNDFTRNIQDIRTLDKSTLLVDLEFFNKNPKVILDNDTMEYAAGLFYDAQKAGRKITKLLVVDGDKNPIGLIGEPDLARWETAQI